MIDPLELRTTPFQEGEEDEDITIEDSQSKKLEIDRMNEIICARSGLHARQKWLIRPFLQGQSEGCFKDRVMQDQQKTHVLRTKHNLNEYVFCGGTNLPEFKSQI